MFCIEMAELLIAIDNRYESVKRFCGEYVVEQPNRAPDMTVRATDEEIEHELAISEINPSPAYAEAVCVYRTICKQLPVRFSAYLLHCAVIEYEGKGYAFAAKSGTGKSTHISIWQRVFGDSVRIINGDKPIVRFRDDELLAYGTPWCGKEGYQTKASVPLKAICFLERAPQNSICRISPKDAVLRIFSQILSPEDVESVDALFPLLDRTLKTVPCFLLSCNMEDEAATVAYNGMNA